MSSVMMVVLGMMIVTYLPRLIPFYIVSNKPISKKIKRFLSYVPITALGALIIPGAFIAIEGEILVSCIGIVFCVVYAYFKGGVITTVVGSIAIAYLLLVFL